MVQIPNLGPGSASTLPIPNPGTTTPNLGLSLCVPPDSAANFAAIDALLSGAGAPGAALPIIQAFLQQTNVNTPQSLSLVAPAGNPSFYEIPMYLNSHGDGAGGSTAVLTLQWTGVSGTVHTAVLTVSGTVAGQVQLETLPVLALGGSTVSVTTAFSSTSFHYSVASRIQVLPL